MRMKAEEEETEDEDESGGGVPFCSLNLIYLSD